MDYYNKRTWNMYYRIMRARKRDPNNNFASLARSTDRSIEEARRRESRLAINNAGPEEIFQLEL